MTVGEQVITIFAGSSGLLDDIAVETVGQLVTSFLQWLAKEHIDYINEINTTKKLSDHLVEKLTEAIKTHKSHHKSQS
jgi:F-type H+-transporting ATPase subunit alpha